jgi:Lysine methyltransferase
MSAVASAHLLLWGQQLPTDSAFAEPFDWVVAGDVLYKHELVQPLLDTVLAALRCGSTTTAAAATTAVTTAGVASTLSQSCDHTGSSSTSSGSSISSRRQQQQQQQQQQRSGLLLCHIPRAGVGHDEVAAAIAGSGLHCATAACSVAASGIAGVELCEGDAVRARVYTATTASTAELCQ